MKKAFTNRRATASLQATDGGHDIWIITLRVEQKGAGEQRHCIRVAMPRAGKKARRAALRAAMGQPISTGNDALNGELSKPHWRGIVGQAVATPGKVASYGKPATPISLAQRSARTKRKAAALKASREEAEAAAQRRREQWAKDEAAAQAAQRRANNPDLIARRIHEQQRQEREQAAAQRRHIDRNQGECGFALLELVDELGSVGINYTPAQFAQIAIARGLIAEKSRKAMTALALRNLPQIARAAL